VRRHVKSAHAGHPDIDERDIGPLLFSETDALGAAGRTVRVMAEELQDAQHALNQVHVVVNNHDS
jgi:hypothetical protein